MRRRGVALAAAVLSCALIAMPAASGLGPRVVTGIPADLAELVGQLEQDRAALASIQAHEQAAWRAAELLVPAARAAELEVERRQGELDSLARASYMNGKPTVTQLIIESDSVSVSDAIQGISYQLRVADAKIDATNFALEHAEDQQSIFLEAVNGAYSLAAERIHLRQVIEDRVAELRARAKARGAVELLTAFTSVDDAGCPTAVPAAALVNLPDLDVNAVCRAAQERATSPQAAAAIGWAFSRLGSPYACKGAGREGDFRYDCSSLVGRAYEAAAGVATRPGPYLPTTATMLSTSSPTWQVIDPADLKPGDLVLYDTCPRVTEDGTEIAGDADGDEDAAKAEAAAAPIVQLEVPSLPVELTPGGEPTVGGAPADPGLAAEAAAPAVVEAPAPAPTPSAAKQAAKAKKKVKEPEPCTTRHVVMYLGTVDGRELMLHTNRCGGVANVTEFWGTKENDHGVYLASRRVAVG